MNGIKSLQNVCLEILKEVDRVCRKYSILYWLEGGTMLGAVRHRGFIPWDDDLDIAMFREDYDRFCEIAPQELKSGYFLQTRKTDPEYPLFFAKVRKNNTFIDEAKLDCFNIHKGIFIDIFPVDKMPKTTAKIKRHRLYLWFLFRLYFQTGKNTVPVSPFLSKPGLKFLLKSVKINKDKLYNYINKVYTKYNADKEYDYTASWTMAQKFNWLYKKEWHESFIEVPFEDMTAKIPVGYDELLTNAYGDYMTPPPKDKQAPGHGLSFLTDVEGDSK